MKDVVYLDNNATTKPSIKALKAAYATSAEMYGNPSSSHERGKVASKILSESRSLIGDLLGITDPDHQLIFTSGATESNNIVLRGRVARTTRSSRQKCHIISTNVEHASVYVTLKDMEKHGLCSLTIVKVNKEGFVNPLDIEKAIKPGETVLVSIIVGHNEVGTIQNTQRVVEICQKHKGVHCHFDLTQVVGRYPLNFAKMEMDSASFSAHKFHGIRGTGGLYLRNKNSIDTIVTGGLQEQNIRAGTENLAGVVAMAIALQECLRNLSPKMKSTEQKRNWIQSELVKAFPGEIVVNGPHSDSRRLYNTLSVSQARVKGTDLLRSLSNLGVCVSVGSACSKSSGSKTLQAINLPGELQDGTLRISLSHNTTWSECKKAVEAIVHCLKHKGCPKHHSTAPKTSARRSAKK